MASEEFSEDLKFLDSLFTAQNTTFDVLNQMEQLKMNNVLNETAAYLNSGINKEELDAEKAESEQLKKQINEKMEILKKAEEELEGCDDRNRKLETDLQFVCDKVSASKQELHKLKRLQKPGSGDIRKFELKSNLLKFYENLFKMKLIDTAHVPDKPKNFVQGFIYNNSSTYVKNFSLPVQSSAWNLLAPAAHLSWGMEESGDEENEDPLKGDLQISKDKKNYLEVK
ncbi:hypothetical protein WDU94_004983 [Cyamophila willieti]